MIKGILQKLIKQKLGKYIKNFSSQQLKTDLLGGEITMSNIQLKNDYFNDLLSDTIMQLDFSSIGKLFVQAPLTKLSTVPVVVLVEDVYFLVKVKNGQNISAKQKLSNDAEQRLMIEYIKKLFDKMMSNLNQKQDQGYFAKIMNRVIDNLTIKISKVHVRIQNHASSPNYSTGITIDELSLQSTDDNWNLKFIDRYDKDEKSQTTQKITQKVKKLLNVKFFSWYWEGKDQKDVINVSMLKSYDQKLNMMKSIYNEPKSQKSQKQQLLSITSTARIQINPLKDLQKPLYELSLDLQPINLNIQEQTLHQMIHFSNLILGSAVSSKPRSDLMPLQKQKTLRQIHIKQLQKLVQQVVFLSNQSKQYDDFYAVLVKKLGSDKILTQLKTLYELESLLKFSQTFIKAQVMKIKEKKIKKQNKGWFSKEKQLTQKQRLQLQNLVQKTFLQASIKRPKSALFVSLALLIKKLSIKVQNQHQQSLILQLEYFSLNTNLSKDLKYLSVQTVLQSIQLYYTSNLQERIVLIKNYASKETSSDNLFSLFLKFQEKNKVKSTLIQGRMTKLLISYEHFLFKKINSFLNSILSNNTQHIKKMIDKQPKKQRLNDDRKNKTPEFEYLFQVNMQIISPTFLLPIQQKEYDDNLENSKISKNSKQCWAFDLGCLSIKKLQNVETHRIKLDKFSMKHYKSFKIDGQFNQVNQLTYSFISNLDIQGSVHISDKKQLNVELSIKRIQLSLNYAEYSKIYKIFKLFMQFFMKKKHQQKENIIKSALWSGLMRKKQYKIDKGYTYIDYWGVLTPFNLYFFPNQQSFTYKQRIQLSKFTLNSSKCFENKEQSGRSSQISDNDNFFSKIEIKNHERVISLKVGYQNIVEFQQKLYPLLDKTQQVSRLDLILEDIQSQTQVNSNEDQQVFEEFDDIDEQQEFKDCQKYESHIKVISETTQVENSPKIFANTQITLSITEVFIKYQRQEIEESQEIHRNKSLCEIVFQQIKLEIGNNSISSQVSIKYNFENFQFKDYLYQYKNAQYNSLICVKKFSSQIIYKKLLKEKQFGPEKIELQSYQASQHNTGENLENLDQQIRVDVQFGLVLLNWKPDVFLQIIKFFKHAEKQISQISPQKSQKKNVHQINMDAFIKENPQFWQRKISYDKAALQKPFDKKCFFIPQNKSRIHLQVAVTQASINFMHRQSHVRVFKIQTNNFHGIVQISQQFLHSDCTLKDLKVFDTSGYPKSQYSEQTQSIENENLIFGKKDASQQQNLLKLRFIKYDNEMKVVNKERINCWLDVKVNPSTLTYFQQPILRVIDYALVQVIILLTEHKLLLANQLLKTQLSKLRNSLQNEDKINFQKQAVFVLFTEYEELLKKILHPLLTYISVSLIQPEIIVKATKQQTFSLVICCPEISIQSSARITQMRVISNLDQNTRKYFNFYEEEYQIQITDLQILKQQQNGQKSPFSNKVNGVFAFNRLLNENVIEKLLPSSKLIRDYNCSLKLSTLAIPQLIRQIYQSLLKIVNFNISYDDGKDFVFIHNYQITKLKQPNLINFQLQVQKMVLECVYDEKAEDHKIMLIGLEIHDFILSYHRNKYMDSQVKVNFQNLKAYYPETKQSNDAQMIMNSEHPAYKTLINYSGRKSKSNLLQNKKDIIFFQMLKNNGAKQIKVSIDQVIINLDLKTILVVKQFFDVQKWVYPVKAEINKFMSFLCQIENVQIYLPNMKKQTFKNEEGFVIKGVLVFKYIIRQTYTLEYLQQMLMNHLVDEKQIKEVGQCNKIDLKLWINFFYYRKNLENIHSKLFERRILPETAVLYTDSQQYGLYKRYEKIKKTSGIIRTSNIGINFSSLNLKIAFSDYLLFQKIMNDMKVQSIQAKKLVSSLKKKIYQDNINAQKDESLSNSSQQTEISSIQFFFGGILLMIYDIKFNPIIQLKMKGFDMLKKNRKTKSQITFQLIYFNQDTFAWEPFIQENIFLLVVEEVFQDQNIQKSSGQKCTYCKISLKKELRINFTKQLLKCLIDLKTIYNRLSFKNQANSFLAKQNKKNTPFSQTSLPQLDRETQFISHYSIKNQTGYPIQIFNKNSKQIGFVMNQEFYDCPIPQKEKDSNQTLGFKIMHEKYDFQTVYGLNFDINKKLKIKLKTKDNKFLNDTVCISTYCRASKKVLLIASNKCIKDFTNNNLLQTYLPFDHSNVIQLTSPEKIKASLFDNDINKRIKSKFNYIAHEGCLSIKHPKIVYNYTSIPLQINQSFAIPGQFVGINSKLYIQGIYHEEQKVIKVIDIPQKGQCYLYSPAYLIDYTGKLDYKFDLKNISSRFSYQTIEQKRKITIYLLPSIDYKFYVKLGSEDLTQVDPKLGKQTIQLKKNKQLHLFTFNSYLSNFSCSLIKDLKKVIEVTEAIYVVNQTDYNLMLMQKNSNSQVLYLKKNQKIPFYWQNLTCSKQLQISPDIPHYGTSCFFNLQNNESFLVPHSSKDYKLAKFFSMICQVTKNIDFIIIQECKIYPYEITNQLENSKMSIYFKLQSESSLIDLDHKQKVPLGFIDNSMRKQFFVQITLQQNDLGYISQKIKIQNFENSLFQKKICLRPDTGRKQQLKWATLQITFENKKKILKVTKEKTKAQEKCQNKNAFQLLMRIPSIYISFIGKFQLQRKEILVFIFENLGVEITKTMKALTYSVVLQNLRVQNLYKKSPYFEVIFLPEKTSSKCFMKFVYNHNLNSPNLVYYLGFSMGQAIVNITSQQMQVILENYNQIIEQRNMIESEENLSNEVNFYDKLNPSYLTQTNDFLYFVEAQIYPLRLSLTFKNVSGWGGVILKAFGNIKDCQLEVDGKKINNVLFPNFQTFTNGIGDHIVKNLEKQLFSFVGSLTLISTPLNLATKIRTGIQNFVTLPAQQFKNGPIDVGKGVVLGTGSLLKNTLEGVFEGAQSVGNMIGNGLSILVADDDFNKKRAEIKNKKSSNVIQGLGHGVQSVFNGVAEGITGAFIQPVKGAEKGGIGGFFKGGLKGITGLVTKPLTGIVDGVSKTAQGIKNTTKVFQPEKNEKKEKRVYLKRPFYNSERLIKPYDRNLAYWNQLLEQQVASDFLPNLSYVRMYNSKTNSQSNLILIITPTHLIQGDNQHGEIGDFINISKIEKIQVSKNKPNTVVMRREKNESIETIEFGFINLQTMRNFVSDIQWVINLGKPSVFYRNDDS